MLKITINNEEVVSNKDFTIEEEMLNTSSVILNNVYPKSWENDKDYVSRFYHPNDYSKCLIKDEDYTPAEPGLNEEGTNFQVTADTTKLSELTSMKGNTSQSGTPTPTAPVPINVVSGRQDVVVAGKNLFDSSTIVAGDIKNANPTIRLCSIQELWVEPGTYTFSTNMTSPFRYTVGFNSIGKPPLNAYPTYSYETGWQTASSTTFTITVGGYLSVQFSKTGNATLTVEEVQAFQWQLEKGNQATSYETYKGNTYEINLGKNLLPYPYIDSSKTLYGITYTVNQDGSITCNGTATNNSTFTLCNQNTSGIRQLLLNNACYLSGCASGGSSSSYRLQLYGWNTSGGGSLVDYGNGVSLSTFVNETKNFNISIFIANGATVDDLTFYPMIEKGSKATIYAPYKTPIELCKIGNYQDRIYKNGNKWYLEKKIGKVIIDGTTGTFSNPSTNRYNIDNLITDYRKVTGNPDTLSNYYQGYAQTANNASFNSLVSNVSYGFNLSSSANTIRFKNTDISSTNDFKTWLGTHNTTVYYVQATTTTTEITDTELISQLNSIELLEGLNNVSVVSPYLQGIINIHYNYVNEITTSDLLFCGVVKNSGNISLNPRYPHYQTLQILDFKTFLSEGETLDFVIANKTIEEAIDQVVDTISPYGFIKGNIEILGAETIIGAYSTKDKTAYDVFNYLADITQSRWTTRLIDENTVAIDFYDPTLLPRGETIQYNETWFRNNLIDDISYSYGSNDYRNKQVMTSKEVIGELEQVQIVYANGYQTQFMTEIKIAQINEIDVNGEPKTYATEDDKELGVEADFYYSIGNNIIESADTYPTGAVITIRYLPIVEGRQIITNNDEIDRVSTATGRKGVVARYEDRNDAITSNELQLIGQSYIRYKGVPEIKLNVQTRSNLWNIGDRVQFNAPITELATEYMVKKKTINRILANPDSEEHIVYTFELTSSFNSEQAINYFDNQRAKSKGNIGEGEAISRNIDIENETNIIFYDSNIVEITVVGDNVLNSTLNSPLNN